VVRVEKNSEQQIDANRTGNPTGVCWRPFPANEWAYLNLLKLKETSLALKLKTTDLCCCGQIPAHRPHYATDLANSSNLCANRGLMRLAFGANGAFMRYRQRQLMAWFGV
jgi:hypothetical protein